jgi:hypothetical protein
MYGSWSVCPCCGSWSFNDEYFRQSVYQNQRTSTQPDLLAAYRRQVPSAPMEHAYGEIGVSSSWWYLPGMYSPSKKCSCTMPPPSVSDPGERMARNMRARTEVYEAEQQATAVERTGQLYRIPRISEDFVATECITWPRYQDGHFKMQHRGQSLLDLPTVEARALAIVVLNVKVQKEGYGGPVSRFSARSTLFNWKKVGLSRYSCGHSSFLLFLVSMSSSLPSSMPLIAQLRLGWPSQLAAGQARRPRLARLGWRSQLGAGQASWLGQASWPGWAGQASWLDQASKASQAGPGWPGQPAGPSRATPAGQPRIRKSWPGGFFCRPPAWPSWLAWAAWLAFASQLAMP